VAPLTVPHETVNVAPVVSVPVRVTVRAPGAGGGVDAGAVTVKVTLPDVPPPGEGVTTLTGIELAVARSEAVIAARS
jgi:hypothetical protein